MSSRRGAGRTRDGSTWTARHVYAARLDSTEKLIAQHQAELEYATVRLSRGQRLADRSQISQDELGDLALKAEVFRRQGEQVQAQKAAHLAQGTLEAETELSRREHDLADQSAALALLEAGPRPEEVEAQEARLARLLEEVRHLDGLRERLLIRSPGPGQVTTTRSASRSAISTARAIRSSSSRICIASRSRSRSPSKTCTRSSRASP